MIWFLVVFWLLLLYSIRANEESFKCLHCQENRIKHETWNMPLDQIMREHFEFGKHKRQQYFDSLPFICCYSMIHKLFKQIWIQRSKIRVHIWCIVLQYTHTRIYFSSFFMFSYEYFQSLLLNVHMKASNKKKNWNDVWKTVKRRVKDKEILVTE